jgi:prephenate dehydratase
MMVSEKIAYLGPQFTFSHEVANKLYPGAIHVPATTIPEIFEKVLHGICDYGLVPLFNTSAKNVAQTFNSLEQFVGRVFINRFHLEDIVQNLLGFGTLRELKEIRSKDVVFPQISEWLKMVNAKFNMVYTESTSEAIGSLSPDLQGIGAIGSTWASKQLQVPIIAPCIQNLPNRTCFCIITRATREYPAGKRHLLIAVRNPVENPALLDEVVTRCECRIPWEISWKQFRFYQISSRDNMVDASHTASNILQSHGAQVVIVGMYDSCLNELFEQITKPINRSQQIG